MLKSYEPHVALSSAMKTSGTANECEICCIKSLPNASTSLCVQSCGVGSFVFSGATAAFKGLTGAGVGEHVVEAIVRPGKFCDTVSLVTGGCNA